MNLFALDASALAKRYSAETGADRVDYLFDHVQRERLCCLMLGLAEVVSVLVRCRNRGTMSHVDYLQAISNLKTETLDNADFATISVDDDLIVAALRLIEKHSVNATDAVFLSASLDLADQHRAERNDLILVASDKRLLKAAQAEGLATFDPETQTLIELEALASP